MRINKKMDYSVPSAEILDIIALRSLLADSNSLTAGGLYDGLDTEDEDFFTK